MRHKLNKLNIKSLFAPVYGTTKCVHMAKFLNYVCVQCLPQYGFARFSFESQVQTTIQPVVFVIATSKTFEYYHKMCKRYLINFMWPIRKKQG